MIHKTIVQSLTLLLAKYHMFKRNDIHMAGCILIHCTFSMTPRFFIFPSFVFTQNPCIDKNYTLRIFMLSGSIQFYSNFQFNMTCIYHKTMPFISNYTHAYSFSHAFTLQIIDHIKICISTGNKSFNSNHEIQTYTLKDVFSLQISFFTDQSLLSHFVYTIHIHDRFR